MNADNMNPCVLAMGFDVDDLIEGGSVQDLRISEMIGIEYGRESRQKGKLNGEL